MKTRVCVCVRVCVCGFPSRPTSLSSIQSEHRTATRASRPWSGGSSSSRERSEETVGEGHVCTHCRAQQHSSSSNACNGRPLFRSSLVRKVDRCGAKQLKSTETCFFFPPAVLLFTRASHFFFHTQMKRLRNASGNATSKPNASIGLSPIQAYTFVVSSLLVSIVSCQHMRKVSVSGFHLKVGRSEFAPLGMTRCESE